jgi:hypothetical protein
VLHQVNAAAIAMRQSVLQHARNMRLADARRCFCSPVAGVRMRDMFAAWMTMEAV